MTIMNSNDNDNGNGRLTESITQEYLHSILNYDRKTGWLTWKPRTTATVDKSRVAQWNARYAGTRAGEVGLISGRMRNRMTIQGQKLSILRIAWIFVNGDIDEYDEIYPANGDKCDIRYENLLHRRVAKRVTSAGRTHKKHRITGMDEHKHNNWVIAIFGIIDTLQQDRLNEVRGLVHRSNFLNACGDLVED